MRRIIKAAVGCVFLALVALKVLVLTRWSVPVPSFNFLQNHLDAAKGSGVRPSGWAATEDDARDGYPETRMILDAIDAQPGMTIADIGAGAGYYTFKLAKVIGPSGRVIATEIDQSAVSYLEREKTRRGLSNVDVISIPVLASLRETALPTNAVDVILQVLVYVYHPGGGVFAIVPGGDDDTRAHLRDCHRALRDGGRLVVFWDVEDQLGPLGRTIVKAVLPAGVQISPNELEDDADRLFEVVSQRSFHLDRAPQKTAHLVVLRKRAAL
jgi:precorrin-6B methylase 2